MKIITVKEESLLEYLEYTLNVEFNSDNFYSIEDYDKTCKHFQELNQKEAEAVCILAKAFAVHTFDELEFIYNNYKCFQIKIYQEDDINEIYKQIAIDNLSNGDKLTRDSAIWDWFDYDEFARSCEDFYELGQCDFNGNHYFVVDNFAN